CNGAIVGAGPAGIGAAVALGEAGIKDVVVFDREAQAGGIPRHIHHPTFGLLVFKRPMSGPRFIEKIIARCKDVRFELETSITGIEPAGVLAAASCKGSRTIHARHIILATGAREKPRHPRLVSGLRPQGIMTTGAVQKFIYGEKLSPFKRPIIVGTELVSFSALATLRAGGAKALAMIESNSRISAYRPAMGFGALMGTPVHLNSQLVDIGGRDRVEFVTIKGPDGTKNIACDGVIFSGDFVGETALMQSSHLEMGIKSRLPLVDNRWLSSDNKTSVIGNCVHPADMGDQCYLEGLEAGRNIGQILTNKVDNTSGEFVAISHDPGIKFLTPGAVRITLGQPQKTDIRLHVRAPFWGKINVVQNGKVVYSKRHRCQPARRITLHNVDLSGIEQTQQNSPTVQTLPQIEVKLV
ncbi:MAG: NAD(P)/FAD-dependent oxidoreductase, partial [Devosiaceae bacterium]|nr:NAD(P)/FAD-dependent oxidoreductase [Devosiaceae bacterium]